MPVSEDKKRFDEVEDRLHDELPKKTRDIDQLCLNADPERRPGAEDIFISLASPQEDVDASSLRSLSPKQSYHQTCWTSTWKVASDEGDQAKVDQGHPLNQGPPTATASCEVEDLEEENAKLQVSESQKALEAMKANAESSTRVLLVPPKTGVKEMSVEDLEAKVKELEEMKNNSDSKLEELNLESTMLQAKIQDLGGPEEAQQEQEELVDLNWLTSMLEVQNASIQEQQKETVDMLMGERLDEVDRLQDARDAVRIEILKAKKHGRDDTRSQDERLAKLEEQLVLARQDCEKMREKVVEIGMGMIFNAAILSLQREDSDWKAFYQKELLMLGKKHVATQCSETDELNQDLRNEVMRLRAALDQAQCQLSMLLN